MDSADFGYCRDCRFYETQRRDVGVCSRITEDEDAAYLDVSEGAEQGAQLVVTPDFGCTLYEPVSRLSAPQGNSPFRRGPEAEADELDS